MSLSGRAKLNSKYGRPGSNDDFLEKAIDALSVIKISNSYLQSTIGNKNPDAKTIAAFSMIKKSLLRVEAFLDSAKQGKNFTLSSNTLRSSQKIKKSWFPLSQLLQMTKPKNLPLQIQLNLPKNDFDVFGNFYKLVVVFTNLIENSIEAMKDNGVINIAARESVDQVIIEVKDSGPGIPDDLVKKVFSSLYTTKPDGNGLGLKMSKTIIEMHGGTISVRNNPTTFIIKLPKN